MCNSKTDLMTLAIVHHVLIVADLIQMEDRIVSKHRNPPGRHSHISNSPAYYLLLNFHQVLFERDEFGVGRIKLTEGPCSDLILGLGLFGSVYVGF